jgi:hypothetical protein
VVFALRRMRRFRFRQSQPVARAPPWLDSYDSMALQQSRIKRQHTEACRCLSGCRNINQADDAAMQLLLEECQRAKVLVERDEDASLLVGDLKDAFIAWVLRPIPRIDDIMACVAQRLGRCAPYSSSSFILPAPYELELASAGSTRSCPTIRRA